MDEIIQVINTMIENHTKIGNVKSDGSTFYFLYDGKHIFSITPKTAPPFEGFWVYVYPNAENKWSIEGIIKNNHSDYQELIPTVVFDSDDYKNQEATETFKDLMQVIQSKLYGVDKVFADILKTRRRPEDEV
jgi:hypothetical protein